MWQKQFNAKPEPDAPLYVIGDIHGRCDLLFRLISMIDADAEEREITTHSLVFLGDYVDRGPQSALTLNLIATLKDDPERRVITLKGNHEDMLLKYIADPAKGKAWVKNGGYETLVSYGINGVTEHSDDETHIKASKQLGREIGVDVLTFLSELDLSFQSGNIFVSHAGADPTLALDKQKNQTLMWGSSKFKTKKRKDKIWVAHGHYADPAPEVKDGRISCDTGAYFSNQLTAARILSDEIKFLTAEV